MDESCSSPGAESGIGRQTALRAAGEGDERPAIGLDPSALDSLVREVRAIGSVASARAVDVSDADALSSAVEALANELGIFSVAHANAGVLFPPATVMDLSLDEWNHVLAVNLTGVLLPSSRPQALRPSGRSSSRNWLITRHSARTRALGVFSSQSRSTRPRSDFGPCPRTPRDACQRGCTGSDRHAHDQQHSRLPRTRARSCSDGPAGKCG